VEENKSVLQTISRPAHRKTHITYHSIDQFIFYFVPLKYKMAAINLEKRRLLDSVKRFLSSKVNNLPIHATVEEKEKYLKKYINYPSNNNEWKTAIGNTIIRSDLISRNDLYAVVDDVVKNPDFGEPPNVLPGFEREGVGANGLPAAANAGLPVAAAAANAGLAAAAANADMPNAERLNRNPNNHGRNPNNHGGRRKHTRKHKSNNKKQRKHRKHRSRKH